MACGVAVHENSVNSTAPQKTAISDSFRFNLLYLFCKYFCLVLALASLMTIVSWRSEAA